jgi:glycosyltransferase involved in cell wall biosynthesis
MGAPPMKVLFLHDAFPGQYRHLAAALAADPACRVVFASAADGELAGVERRRYAPARPVSADIHHYLRWGERAVLNGQAVYRACRALRKEGFIPDVVCAHAGWGPALYVKDAFPNCRLVGYFEWYYRGYCSDADYLEPLSENDALCLRTRNSTLLLELAQCDAAVTPTRFQRDQFPDQIRPRLTVLHDGIDTGYFQPAPRASLIPQAEQVVTFATRGMEPYRGFPHFMRALALLQRRHPRLHAVIAGEDKVFYGRPLPEGESWRQRLLAELPELDRTRLHFTGPLAYDDYRRLLRGSDVHVYLTVPFVLSWSLLEAMACGCLVVASDTAPVREVIDDGRQGLLVDFRDPAALADRIETALALGQAGRSLRAAARQKVVTDYALADLLPRQLRLLKGLPTLD